MKFTAAIFIAASSLLVNASDLGNVIAKRQVNTRDLRMGTRRLSARQNGPSPTPSILLSQFIDCPAAPIGFIFNSGNAMRSAVTGSQSSVGCTYRDITDATLQFSCIYNGDTGSQTSADPLIGSCQPQLATAPVSGSCAQACPRRNAGFWYTSSAFSNAGGFAETSCAYANTEAEAMAGTSTFSCKYEAGTGNFVSKTGEGDCPNNLGISSYCVQNLAQ